MTMPTSVKQWDSDAALRFGPQARRRAPAAPLEAADTGAKFAAQELAPYQVPRTPGYSRRWVAWIGLAALAPAVALSAVILLLNRQPAIVAAAPEDSHATELASQRAEFAVQVEALRQEGAANRAALARLEAHLADAAKPASSISAPPSDAPPTPVQGVVPASVPEPAPQAGIRAQIEPAPAPLPIAANPEAAAPPPAVALPSGLSARVILHYARGSASARTRAAALAQTLRARGLEMANPVDVPATVATSGVIFFYADDRRSAEWISDSLGGPKPVQRRPAAGLPLPPPGTIEVAIAGS